MDYGFNLTNPPPSQTGIPMVFVQGDVSTGLTRELASLMRSVAMATVPKITLVTGHTHGHAYLAMVRVIGWFMYQALIDSLFFSPINLSYITVMIRVI